MGRKQEKKPDYDSDTDGGSSELESLNCCQLKVHRKRIKRARAEKHHLDATYNGPLKNRSCTDVICLLLFIVFIAAWVALGIYAFARGSPGEIFAPHDTDHKKCGFDEGVDKKPYLLFFDLVACLSPVGGLLTCKTPQVCIEECPTDNFYFDFYANLLPASDIAKMMICVPGTPDLSILDIGGLRKLIEDGKCASWYLQSVSVANRCLPDLSAVTDLAGEIEVNINGTITKIPGVTGNELDQASFVVQALSSVNEFSTAVVKDLMETWPWILLCIGGSMIVSLLYIIIMRWIAGIVVWCSLVASIALFAFCSYVSWTKYYEIHNSNDTVVDTAQRFTVVHGTPYGTALRRVSKSTDEPGFGDVIEGAIQDSLNSYLRMETTWLVFFIISVSILAILLLLMIFLRNRIRIAIALINEGSRAVAHSWSTLFFPIFPWILQTGVICYGVAICLYLFSSGIEIYRVDGLNGTCQCGTYKNGDLCFPDKFADDCKSCLDAVCSYITSESHDYTVYFQLYNLFIFFWALFFVGAVGQLILSSTFATYYFTFNKDDIPFFIVASSSWRVIRYHLGTAAFGSLLLAIVSWFRALLELADGYLKKYDNEFVKAVKCCLRCFFWCLEKFLRFLNKNAYIMCSIHGKNFCVSAKDAFMLLLENIVRVFVLDKVTDFLFFISKLVITAAVGAGSFYIFSKPVVNLQNLNGDRYESNYTFVPIVFTIIGTYFIASIFFNVYSMAVDTLFLCFLEDNDKNDGTPEKPYYMTKNLMSIIGKKNKPENNNK